MRALAFDVAQDNKDLMTAVEILEFPTFLSKTQQAIGMPMELVLQKLPRKITNSMSMYTEKALEQAFRVVLTTVNPRKTFQRARSKTHRGLVVTTGALGGFFGGAAMAFELPLSTSIMMRSIAEIAREQGENLAELDSRLACMVVLGLDTTRSATRFGVNTSGYFHLRHLFASEVRKAADYLVTNAFAEETAPIVARLLNKVAERFGIQLTEKLAAELVPLIGAAGGATINYLFISHFQRIARGHFTVRRLERKYGARLVQAEYEHIYQMLRTDVHRTNLVESSLDEVAVSRDF